MNETMENTSSLVSSQDVTGTSVYGRSGEEVGTIDHLVIDKQSGKVAYAVMAFGGFLGMGEEFYSIPWGKLHYDTEREGFMTDITESQLRGAPERPDNWHRDRDWELSTYRYYDVPPYWL